MVSQGWNKIKQRSTFILMPIGRSFKEVYSRCYNDSNMTNKKGFLSIMIRYLENRKLGSKILKPNGRSFREVYSRCYNVSNITYIGVCLNIIVRYLGNRMWWTNSEDRLGFSAFLTFTKVYFDLRIKNLMTYIIEYDKCGFCSLKLTG